MPANYVLLERIELNASAASVTFDNIPQTGYTDLKVVISARTDNAAINDNVSIRPNGATTNRSARRIYGNGTSALSDSLSDITVGNIAGASATANTFGNAEFYVPNYTGSTNKSFSNDGANETNGGTVYMSMVAGLWSNTAAITSFTLVSEAGANFVQYSTFSLYGLAAVGTTPVIAPKASGGNIYNDGTYWYHAFLASGTFTPQTSLSCDVLVVAGGGSGGGSNGGFNVGAGGGGAGGLLTFTSQSVSTAQTVTVGAGGTAIASQSSTVGNNGSDSQFGSLTLVKGGGGGGRATNTATPSVTAGATGGSGGGGGSQVGAAGSATSGQGYAGGASTTSNYGAAGGGGAGGVGTSISSGDAGVAGGVGLSTAISGGSVTNSGQLVGGSYYFAGGGAGGSYNATQASGGNGGGGAGGTSVNSSAVSGTANTGGGGGGTGSSGTNPSGAGGSGIVIIRYTI